MLMEVAAILVAKKIFDKAVDKKATEKIIKMQTKEIEVEVEAKPKIKKTYNFVIEF